MQRIQSGFGGLQFLLVAGILVVVAMVAVPKYRAYVTRAQVSEAVNLAQHSKRMLVEFYTFNNRFPRTPSEALSTTAETVSSPEFVREVHVEPSREGRDVKVLVYLKEGVVDNPTGEDQYIYVSGAQTEGPHSIEWNCGAQGLDLELLPENCRG